jgi:glycosyltransferase involved in cell wall biosynthesis
MRISILTPSFNSAHALAQAIDSVSSQQYADVEHIVADASSTDGTVDILKSRPHVRWVSEPDRGQSDAINKAFALSTGDIIGNLNADDYYLPGAFAAIARAFADPNVMFVVGRVRIEPDDHPAWTNDPRTDFKEMLQWWDRDAYCRNPVGFFYRRQVQETVGGFDIQNHNTMDLDFLLRARQRFDFTKIPATLGVFRLTAATKTARSQSYLDMARKFAICENYLPTDDPAFAKFYRRKSRLAIMKRRERDWRRAALDLAKQPSGIFAAKGKRVVAELPALLSSRISHTLGTRDAPLG